MTTDLKPPPMPVRLHDHPEHCWTWTETELRWIAARDQQWLALVGELQRDAERYRWLRDKSAYVGVNPHARSCLWVLRGIYEIRGAGFDAAIDAARGEKGGV